ncbi:MAG: urea carboxylase-associated family protein [Pseudomonadota bacterium]
MHQPHVPDGTNASLTSAVSSDGRPVLGQRYRVPPRCGVAVRLAKGQGLQVVNPSGHQVCDFFAFVADGLTEYLSMAHLHTSLSTVFPKVGDPLVSNLRRPLLTLTEDTSPGVHDTIVACCDHARYQELGCDTYHDNCADNLRMALMAIGLKAPLIPAPFNIWMNVPLAPNGGTQFVPPVSRPGDRVEFRAEVEVIAVMSACPQDQTPVNGVGVAPGPLAFEVFG